MAATSRNAGNFHWVHQIAVGSKGDIGTGNRIQKFVAMGAG
jgi:hypothetical protein